MKITFHAIRQNAILLIFALLPFLSFAQGAQWVTSVNVGGVPKLADWVYDVITTSEKNYFCVGFAKEDEHTPNSPRKDVPAFCLLSPSGTLLGDGYIEILSASNEIASGRLYNVVEGTDAYFAVGFIQCFDGCQKGILVKVDKTTLAEQHWSIIPNGYTKGRLNDIIHVSANGDNYLIVTGWADDGVTGNKTWIAAYNYDGTLRTTGSVLHEFVTTNQGEAGAITYEVMPDGKVKIFSASIK